MKIKKLNRAYHSIRLLLLISPAKRAAYLKKHNIFASMGENCKWGPWRVPLYPKLIRIGNNVHVHKTAHVVTHDMLNRYLKTCTPDEDYGAGERLGCVELMDNVYVSMHCIVLPNVRIGKDSIISAGSVVTSDIPENSVASGNPAKVVGQFDVFMALREMTKGQCREFENQQLTLQRAEKEWEMFLNRRK